jgi:adenylate cyclase
VNSERQESAWLETPGRDTVLLQGNCSIGRSERNAIILDAPNVSRRHALINVQDVGDFWLIDLGSSNGTFLNKRRVHQPVRLNGGDKILIGDNTFVFRQPIEITNKYKTAYAERTIRTIENVPCWLLVADVENFTPLSRTLVSDELAVLIGGWVAACKEIIEAHEGMIDKYLGDGFFTYWREETNTTKRVAAALKELKEEQAKERPRFRLALHFGMVAIGGVPSMGEESLMGKDVNFVFRMEKLAGSLGISLIASVEAHSKLGELMKGELAGRHELKGFEGKYDFFSC